METITLYHDVRVFYVKKNSSCRSLSEVYRELLNTVPHAAERMFYGIKIRENGNAHYRLAVEQLTFNEHKLPDLESYIVRKGVYLSQIVRNYLSDIKEIDRAFENLKNAAGQKDDDNRVEWYLNRNDVACMLYLSQE